MSRAQPVVRSTIANRVALLLLSSLVGCAASSPPTIARVAPVPGLEDAANECATIRDLVTLKHTPHTPYGGTLRNDKAVEELALLWPPNRRLAEAMVSGLARKRSNGTYDEADLGFGVVRASLLVPSGHVWCAVSAVLFRGEFASAEARCGWRFAGKGSECIASRYREVFAELGMAVRLEGAVARIDYVSVLESMDQARLSALGLTPDRDQSSAQNSKPELVDAESYLRDALNEIRVGSFPGRGGPSQPERPPNGFTAAKTLVDAEALDALRRVLRGPNPEGRGFAAVGLSKLGAVSQDDLQVIDKLKTASPIATQFGCMVTVGSARKFFSNLTSHHYMFEPENAINVEESN